ncbi:hypothetical protein JCM11641_005422 [Rhodosporidiobolus odoratus]
MSLTRSLAALSLQASSRRVVHAFAPVFASSAATSSSLLTSTRQHSLVNRTAFPDASRAYATEASNLGNLSPHAGSSHKRKRIGRGIGSGRGGTSGRGHKGQGARSGNGKPAAHFEGGQTPLTRRYPKRGFTNPNKERLAPLNLERLQHWIDRGLIDPSQPITMRELYETRCVHGIKDGVKLLGDGAEHLTTSNLNIEVSKASQSAIAAIEKLNGSLVARYENRLTLRALIRPDSFLVKDRSIPGKANPILRRDLLYYSDPKHRGYLALEAGAGQKQQQEEGQTVAPEAAAQTGEAKVGEATA